MTLSKAWDYCKHGLAPGDRHIFAGASLLANQAPGLKIREQARSYMDYRRSASGW
jgi:hypothetical protein